MRKVVESWWNGRHGSMARIRVRLCREGNAWSVEREGPQSEYELTPCFSETQARDEMQRLLARAGAANWRRVDELVQHRNAAENP